MHNYFLPKIKATYTFPLDCPFLWVKKISIIILVSVNFLLSKLLFKISPVPNKKWVESSQLLVIFCLTLEQPLFQKHRIYCRRQGIASRE